MKIYCVKCRDKTDTNNIRKTTTSNGRHCMKGECSVCDCKKNVFVKGSTKVGGMLRKKKVKDDGLTEAQKKAIKIDNFELAVLLRKENDRLVGLDDDEHMEKIIKLITSLYVNGVDRTSKKNKDRLVELNETPFE